MGDGWIKLHRKILKSAVSRDPIVGHVWVQLLLRANWERRQLLDGTFLEAGDLVIGQHKFAAEIGMSRHQLRRALSTLGKLGNTASKPASKGTHVTICNWGTYQDGDETSGQVSGQRPASDRPGSGQVAASDRPQKKKERSKEQEERKGSLSSSLYKSQEFLDAWKLYEGHCFACGSCTPQKLDVDLMRLITFANEAKAIRWLTFSVGVSKAGNLCDPDRYGSPAGSEAAQADAAKSALADIQKADVARRKKQRAAAAPFQEMP